MVLRSSVSAMVTVAVGLIAQTEAFEVTLVNSCSEAIDVFDSKTTETLPVGGTSTRTVSPGGAYVYRKGTSGQATLAEFSADQNACWYDISIIPTSEKQGPGNCGSLEECMATTGGVGFNVAMSIEPSKTDGNRCVSLTCMANGCSDAYQFPADDTKTHNCPSSTDFTVTFCPGGSGATQSTDQVDQVANEAQNTVQQYSTPTPTTAAPTEVPSPTEIPAQVTNEDQNTVQQYSTPTPTTAAPTEVPSPTEINLPPAQVTNEMPTEIPSTPIPTPTEPSTNAPSSASTSASGVDAGDTQWNDFVGKVGAHNETSNSSGVDVGDNSSSKTDSDASNKDTTETTGSTITSQPDAYQKSGVQTAGAAQTVDSAGSVEQANTQSSGGSSGGGALIVLCVGAAVGMAAVAAIVVIRKKKQSFDEMDSKTPVLNTMRDGPTDHSVLMTATNHTSTVL
ncbi:hypothetical protein PHMEG_00016306 [Phytophthora megakarya]|uniref:Carbohydrate-binding protein n=1 Tax=Phytophthora megakarya TaxID=4795 RepID=A0A225VZM0_9STRA|nr:hypothetical protein PHMEG_00016306 [Phytophthora megakarya]